ncbi:hypothetical protein [Roseomonas xinghualingensis]|uniref:hypothetical protein n=1 Tax=Roseomonas xinghualingensis TaxID=2986475 RepID=UPI0021F1EB70|nr:hypothetical protein [Roseomonas sp. SXEYE001]MCV4207966.1 hypothetical protein [Roseomonas sp. SXEYE001]
MSSYSLAEAAARLEAAVEQLAQAAAQVAERRAAPAGAGVPAEEVAALSARLEATIARLRAALPEAGEGAEADEELPDEGEEAADAPRRSGEG